MRRVAKEKSPPVFTNVVMLQKKNQEFEHVVAPIEEKGQEIVSLPDRLKSWVIEEYSSAAESLPSVAMTDGAHVIRQHLYAVFGVTFVIVLNWYHLGKKIRDLMSMIAQNKDEKTLHLNFMFYHLWRGEVYTVLDYLKTSSPVKKWRKTSWVYSLSE